MKTHETGQAGSERMLKVCDTCTRWDTPPQERKRWLLNWGGARKETALMFSMKHQRQTYNFKFLKFFFLLLTLHNNLNQKTAHHSPVRRAVVHCNVPAECSIGKTLLAQLGNYHVLGHPSVKHLPLRISTHFRGVYCRNPNQDFIRLKERTSMHPFHLGLYTN